MNIQKIVDELNTQLDSIAREQKKREDRLKDFLKQFKTKHQNLRERLKKESDGNKRLKIKSELKLVRAGRNLLEANLGLR